jgi:hypothetical protein
MNQALYAHMNNKRKMKKKKKKKQDSLITKSRDYQTLAKPSLPPDFEKIVCLLKQTYTHSFTYFLWLFLVKGRVEQMSQRPSNLK